IAGRRPGEGTLHCQGISSHLQGTLPASGHSHVSRPWPMHGSTHHSFLLEPTVKSSFWSIPYLLRLHRVLRGNGMRSSRTLERNYLWSVRRLERSDYFHYTNCHDSGMGRFLYEGLSRSKHNTQSHVARTWKRFRSFHGTLENRNSS
ncbi:mCG1037092, partial [Mus musculus]